MNRTFVAVAVPFLVVGLAFAVFGEFVFWSAFLTLGVVFLVLGLVTGEEDTDSSDPTEDPQRR